MSGHGKGAAFEREVSRRLSLWVTKGERDDLFWRTAMSGGRATLQARKGIVNRAQAGDIGAIDPAGEALLKHITIECKFHKDLVILGSLLTGSGKLSSQWAKHCRESWQSKREPFLIAKENRCPTLLITTERAQHLLSIEAPPTLVIYGWARGSARLSLIKLFLFDDVVPTLKAWKAEEE